MSLFDCSCFNNLCQQIPVTTQTLAAAGPLAGFVAHAVVTKLGNSGHYNLQVIFLNNTWEAISSNDTLILIDYAGPLPTQNIWSSCSVGLTSGTYDTSVICPCELTTTGQINIFFVSEFMSGSTYTISALSFSW